MWSADTRAAQPRLFSLLRRQCRAERGAGSQAHACIGMPTATDDIHRDLERYQEHWHSGRSWYTYPRGRLLALEQNPRSLRRNSRPSKRLARLFLSLENNPFHLTVSRCYIRAYREPGK